MVHRDIKLENMMCTKPDLLDFNIKLTDFGFATPPDSHGVMELTLGTTSYMAPELVRQQKYDERVDSWSVGIVTYYLLTGEEPFFGSTEEVKYQIEHREISFTHPCWAEVSQEAREFVEACCVKDYT